jgi:hypothetical protein
MEPRNRRRCSGSWIGWIESLGQRISRHSQVKTRLLPTMVRTQGPYCAPRFLVAVAALGETLDRTVLAPFPS